MEPISTIQKKQVLTAASNYELLRKKGLEYIEELGSNIWTDYNLHDPGITILELLCYAITDLGYRSNINIIDLLTDPVSNLPQQDYSEQAFFTARDILTVNPWTTADFRKLLIDLEGVKNAWLKCKDCPCDGLQLFVKCAESKLQYQNGKGTQPIVIKGFYDVMIEFDNEEGTGDLNSGKVKYNFSFPVATGFSTAMIEMRLPSWQQLEDQAAMFKDFMHPDSEVIAVQLDKISGNKKDDANIPDADLARLLRKPVFANSILVEFRVNTEPPSEKHIFFTDTAFTIWFKSDEDRKQIKLSHIKQAIEDATASGIFGKYLSLIHRANLLMQQAKNTLHNHRNLCEDYCSIKAIAVQDIGICADIEVEPSADIEAILATVYYRIDQYFSPDIKFYSLQELMEKGVPVDEIFEGPALENGFIDNDQLAATNLKEFIYSSDIINLLMDIDIAGIKTIKSFTLTNFDTDGNLIASNEWYINVNYNQQPRLYLEASKILVYKNGLPFLPDKFELSDTLQVIKGQNTQPKFSVIENNLPVPNGKHFNLNEYYPIQYSLPLTYGVGYDGLPDTASLQRKAQAKQLKAYLLFYEQLLMNYLSQLTHVKDLFSLNTAIDKTYFSTLLNNEIIKGSGDLFNELTEANLQNMVESKPVFLDRRNRFLNQLLSRFAENFNDYALMLYSYSDNILVAQDKLINDKINFLKDFPFMSANRARAIHYKDTLKVCSNENIAGLQLRIKRLLGMDISEKVFVIEHLLLRPRTAWKYFELYEELDVDNKLFERRWRLKGGKQIYLSSSTRYYDQHLAVTEQKARLEIAAVMNFILDINHYQIKKEKKWFINLLDETGEVIAYRQQHFATQALAEKARDGIIEFAKNNLLTDTLLPICTSGNCADTCGDEDPYSFRVTVVLSGETGIANSGIEFRRFAEQTIRTELPAHLAVKICWVSNKQLAMFETAYCNWLSELAKEEIDEDALHNLLELLLEIFIDLKNVYPDAKLHDCVDGDDSNRVFLDNTII